MSAGMDLFTVSDYPSIVLASDCVLVAQTMASYQVREVP